MATYKCYKCGESLADNSSFVECPACVRNELFLNKIKNSTSIPGSSSISSSTSSPSTIVGIASFIFLIFAGIFLFLWAGPLLMIKLIAGYLVFMFLIIGLASE